MMAKLGYNENQWLLKIYDQWQICGNLCTMAINWCKLEVFMNIYGYKLRFWVMYSHPWQHGNRHQQHNNIHRGATNQHSSPQKEVGLIFWPRTRVEFSNKIRWNPIPILVPGSRKTSDRGNLRGKHLLVMFNIFTFSIETSDMIVIPCYSHKYKIYLFTGCIPIND